MGSNITWALFARPASPRHRRYLDIDSTQLFPVQCPAASLPPAKTQLAPKESKLDSTTKYKQWQFGRSHLSESHVKIQRVILLERFWLSLPQLWWHQVTFKKTKTKKPQTKKKPTKTTIYSAHCEEPLNKRITNPITVSGTIRKVLLSHPHNKHWVPAVPAEFSP